MEVQDLKEATAVASFLIWGLWLITFYSRPWLITSLFPQFDAIPHIKIVVFLLNQWLFITRKTVQFVQLDTASF